MAKAKPYRGVELDVETLKALETELLEPVSFDFTGNAANRQAAIDRFVGRAWALEFIRKRRQATEAGQLSGAEADAAAEADDDDDEE